MPPHTTVSKASSHRATPGRVPIESDAKNETTPSSELGSQGEGSMAKGSSTMGRTTSHQTDHSSSNLTIENSENDSDLTEADTEADDTKNTSVTRGTLPGEEDSCSGAVPRSSVDQDGITSPIKTTTKFVGKGRKRKFAKKAKRAPRSGFQAFAKQANENNEEVVKKYRGVNEAIEPQTGIHSQIWADAVIPQSSLLLRIPVEIRTMIFGYVFASFKEFQTIEPHERGNTYWDPGWLNASDETNAMNLICKQIYLDVDTGGWLYQFKTFFFSGYGLLRQFLWAIKPSHKNTIRSVVLKLRLSERIKTLNKPALLALADLKNLKHFVLTIVLDWSILVCISSTGNRYSVPDQYLDMIRQCKELNTLKGLMSFDLKKEFDQKLNWMMADPLLTSKWVDLAKGLKTAMIKEVHDEVRKSNAKLRGLDVPDQAAENAE